MKNILEAMPTQNVYSFNYRKSFLNFQRSRKVGVDTVTKPMGAKRVEWSIWRYVSSVVHDDMIAFKQQIYNEPNERISYTITTQLQKQL